MRRSWLRRAIAWLEAFFAILGVLFVVYHLGFQSSHVTSSSMSPALNGPEKGEADWLLTEKLTYNLRKPARWEIASFTLADGTLVAKRIVGLPGEEVSIRNGQLWVNGVQQTPPASLSYLKYIACGNLYHGASFKCRDDHYYVLGDDLDSQDSRFEGDIPESKIEGRALLRTWPRHRIGLVNP